MSLYDNKDGYENEALRIMEKASEFAQEVLMDYSNENALEILGLIHNGIGSGFCHVSIERRLA